MLAKLVRSYAVDALEARPGATPPARETAQAFLDRVAGAEFSAFDAVGLGTDLRITGDRLVGGGLELEGRLVHLAAFATEPSVSGPDTGFGRMASPRVRRAARARS